MPIGPIVRAMKHNRTRFALIIFEIAITLAIVTNAVNMILAQREQMKKTSGFDDDNILWASAVPFAPEFKEQSYIENVVMGDLRAIRAIPGVKAVAATGFLPWQGGGSSGTMKAEGYPDKFQAQTYGARGDLLGALGAKLKYGRAFTENDTPVDPNESTKVCIISSKLSEKLWGKANPIGRVITSTEGQTPRTVVGVLDEFYNPYSWNIGDYVRFTPGRAFGATKGDILKHFLTENWIVTSIGLFLGIIATYALNFFLVSQLTDTKMPWYLVGVGVVLLWLNGLVATIPPALRAASVSPAIATRTV